MAGLGEYIVVYDLLPEIAAKLDEVLDKAVRKAAFDIQAHAQANITANESVRTGFLKNSVYVTTDEKSTYGEVQEPQEGQELLPEVEQPKKHSAVVAVGANYGVFIEFGTVHMGPKPYLAPAVALVEPQFLAAMAKLEAELEVL